MYETTRFVFNLQLRTKMDASEVEEYREEDEGSVSWLTLSPPLYMRASPREEFVTSAEDFWQDGEWSR